MQIQCPYCGMPTYSESDVCGRCGSWLGEGLAEDSPVRPAVVPPKTEDPKIPPTKVAPQEDPILATVQYLLMLLVGLLPVVGVFYSFGITFGRKATPAKRGLAKAMLWVHGAGLVVAIVTLCIWVFGLVAQLR